MITDIIAARDSDELPFPVGGDMNIVEFIQDTFASGSLTDSVTVTEVDLTKAIVLLIHSFNSGAAGGTTTHNVRIGYTDSTTVIATRQQTGIVNNYGFITAEFPSAISVQFFTTALSAVATADQTITAVDSATNRIFIFPTWDANNGSTQQTIHGSAVLLNDTTVRLTKGDAAGTDNCSFFVVELPPA